MEGPSAVMAESRRVFFLAGAELSLEVDCVYCERCNVLNPESEEYFFIHGFSFLLNAMGWIKNCG